MKLAVMRYLSLITLWLLIAIVNNVVLAQQKVDFFANNAFGNPVVGNTAEHYKGVTYVAYQGENLDPYVAAYDHKKDQWTGPYKAGINLLGQLLPNKVDSHGKPTLVVDGEGYIHLVFGGHGGVPEMGNNPLGNHHAGKQIHVRSKKPLDISEWEVIDNITPFGTYSQLFKMDNGDIYLIFRHGAHRSNWVYQVSNDNCRTFSPVVSFLKAKPAATLADGTQDWDSWYPDFRRIEGNDIIMVYNYHFCKSVTKGHDGERHHAYYMRFDTDNKMWYNVKGEKLHIPVTKEYADSMTLVINTGDRWNHIGHACLNHDDHPHVSWYEGDHEGKRHGGPKQLVHYRWTGNEWTGGNTNLPIEARGELLATTPDSVYCLLGYDEDSEGSVAWWLSTNGSSDFSKNKVLISEAGGKFTTSHFIRYAHPNAKIVATQKVKGTNYSRVYLLGDKGPIMRSKIDAEVLSND